MKLRIKGNSIRLRLTRTEISTLGGGGRIVEMVMFAPQNVLRYEVEAADVPNLSAVYDGVRILIQMPREAAAHLLSSEDVGVQASQEIGGDARLSLIIEKDFTCLTPRGVEDADTFDHPEMGKSAC